MNILFPSFCVLFERIACVLGIIILKESENNVFQFRDSGQSANGSARVVKERVFSNYKTSVYLFYDRVRHSIVQILYKDEKKLKITKVSNIHKTDQ